MFDPKCLELAKHFLPDDAPERHTEGLAQYIQDSIEEWLAGIAEERPNTGAEDES